MITLIIFQLSVSEIAYLLSIGGDNVFIPISYMSLSGEYRGIKRYYSRLALDTF